MKPPIVIIETGDIVPEEAFLIRKVSTNQYVIEESGNVLTIDGNGLVVAGIVLENSIDTSRSVPAASVVSSAYRYKTKAGHWIAFSAHDGQLVATYA